MSRCEEAGSQHDTARRGGSRRESPGDITPVTDQALRAERRCYQRLIEAHDHALSVDRGALRQFRAQGIPGEHGAENDQREESGEEADPYVVVTPRPPHREVLARPHSSRELANLGRQHIDEPFRPSCRPDELVIEPMHPARAGRRTAQRRRKRRQGEIGDDPAITPCCNRTGSEISACNPAGRVATHAAITPPQASFRVRGDEFGRHQGAATAHLGNARPAVFAIDQIKHSRHG